MFGEAVIHVVRVADLYAIRKCFWHKLNNVKVAEALECLQFRIGDRSGGPRFVIGNKALSTSEVK